MIDEQKANDFATHWLDSWNSHDLDSIMSHYAEDVEYFSPLLTKLTDNTTGTLIGKQAVQAYLAKGLAAYPDLEFVPRKIYWGVNSVVIQYKSVKNLEAVEVFELNQDGLVKRVLCHYDQ